MIAIQYFVAICLATVSVSLAFHSHSFGKTVLRSTKLQAIPLELTGRLDASKKWPVKFIFNGEEKVVEVSEGTSFLEVGEKLWDEVDSSCRNGVCITCAGKVRV